MDDLVVKLEATERDKCRSYVSLIWAKNCMGWGENRGWDVDPMGECISDCGADECAILCTEST